LNKINEAADYCEIMILAVIILPRFNVKWKKLSYCKEILRAELLGGTTDLQNADNSGRNQNFRQVLKFSVSVCTCTHRECKVITGYTLKGKNNWELKVIMLQLFV
jgi:hypothetical protein